MRANKRSFSLIEILIAFSLLSILLSSLFVCFKNQLLFFSRNDELEKSTFTKVMLHDYLSSVFLEIPINKQKNNLYSFEDQLFFTFNNGSNKNHEIANYVNGKLYVDKENKNLYLEINSQESDSKQKKLLLKGVETLTFNFIHPITYQPQSTWEQSDPPLPLALSIKVKPDLSLYFILAQAVPLYDYQQERPSS